MKKRNLEKGLRVIGDLVERANNDVEIKFIGDFEKAKKVRSVTVFLDDEGKPSLIDITVA